MGTGMRYIIFDTEDWDMYKSGERMSDSRGVSSAKRRIAFALEGIEDSMSDYANYTSGGQILTGDPPAWSHEGRTRLRTSQYPFELRVTAPPPLCQ